MANVESFVIAIQDPRLTKGAHFGLETFLTIDKSIPGLAFLVPLLTHGKLQSFSFL